MISHSTLLQQALIFSRDWATTALGGGGAGCRASPTSSFHGAAVRKLGPVQAMRDSIHALSWHNFTVQSENFSQAQLRELLTSRDNGLESSRGSTPIEFSLAAMRLFLVQKSCLSLRRAPHAPRLTQAMEK